MINMKKIREKKDLSYLDSWYCPLEGAAAPGINTLDSVNVKSFSSTLYAPGLTREKDPLSIMHRHVMAGL